MRIHLYAPFTRPLRSGAHSFSISQTIIIVYLSIRAPQENAMQSRCSSCVLGFSTAHDGFSRLLLQNTPPLKKSLNYIMEVEKKNSKRFSMRISGLIDHTEKGKAFRKRCFFVHLPYGNTFYSHDSLDRSCALVSGSARR